MENVMINKTRTVDAKGNIQILLLIQTNERHRCFTISHSSHHRLSQAALKPIPALNTTLTISLLLSPSRPPIPYLLLRKPLLLTLVHQLEHPHQREKESNAYLTTFRFCTLPFHIFLFFTCNYDVPNKILHYRLLRILNVQL